MTDQTIRFKDCGIYYLMYENPLKETIVLLHPYASSGLIFDSLIIALKRDYQLIIIDMPGHGKSGVTRNVTFEDMPEIIKVILDQEEILKTHMVGISEGAIVSQGFGQIFSDRLLSLVAISTFSIFHDSYKAVYGELRKTKIKHLFLWLFSFKNYKKYYIEKSSLTNSGKDKFEKTMKGFKRISILSKKGLKRFYKMGKQNKIYPTYVVCGEFDLDIIKDASIQYEQKVPLSTLEGYNNTRQIVFLDNPRLFNDHLITFLKSVSMIGEAYGRKHKKQ